MQLSRFMDLFIPDPEVGYQPFRTGRPEGGALAGNRVTSCFDIAISAVGKLVRESLIPNGEIDLVGSHSMIPKV